MARWFEVWNLKAEWHQTWFGELRLRKSPPSPNQPNNPPLLQHVGVAQPFWHEPGMTIALCWPVDLLTYCNLVYIQIHDHDWMQTWTGVGVCYVQEGGGLDSKWKCLLRVHMSHVYYMLHLVNIALGIVLHWLYCLWLHLSLHFCLCLCPIPAFH